MKVGQLDRCPECGSSNFETLPSVTRPKFPKDAYGQEMQFVARKCKDCGQVIPPRTGQNTGVRILHDSIEAKRDDVGFTHPNLHRRVMYCLCGQEWVCQLHKHIHKDDCPTENGEYVCGGRGHCDCTPGIVCDCATIAISFIRGQCFPARPAMVGVINGTCSGCDGAHEGNCGSCDGSPDMRKGRPTARLRPNESYMVGIHGFNSMAVTEVHLHHEEQTHREVP